LDKKKSIDAEKDNIVKKMNKVEEQLHNIQIDKHAFKTDQSKKDTVNKLKEHFGKKVLGRIIDLCKAKFEKYNVALTVALMANFDSVIVDSLDTAKKCIT